MPDYLTVSSFHKAVQGYPEGPAIEKGFYDLTFRQLLRDIPILGGIQMTMDSGLAVGSGYPTPSCYLASEEEYLIGTGYMVEVEALYEDVPLCPVSLIQAGMETLIEQGKVREIDNIRLGYVLYIDRPTEKVVAFPAWVVRCQHYQNAKEERIFEEGRSAESYYHTQDQLIFNAQTGEMVGFQTTDQDAVYCPKIIPWDEAGKTK
jgi:hypothetical protein